MKANNLNVVLKNVKTFKCLFGIGLDADIFINDLKCMHVFDDAKGGCFDYTPNTYLNPKEKQIKEYLKELDKHISTLPDQEVKLGDDKFTIKVDLDFYVDMLFGEWEENKLNKRLNKIKNLVP